MKRLFLIILACMFTLAGRAGRVYEFNSLCQQAYQEITKLKLNNAQALLTRALQQNPDNLVPVALENYIDFYTLFFNEDPVRYKSFQKNVSKRIDLLKQGPETSPFYNFWLAMVYMQKAGVAMRFGEKWSAGWDFRRGYNYIRQNKKSFPTFSPNDLLYGPMQAIVGTIPSGYKWIAGLFGMKGSVRNGMQLIRGFMNNDDPWARLFFNEAAFLNCYLAFYIGNDKDAVFELIRTRKLDVVNNHLFTYMAANLGIHNKMGEYAEQVLKNRNASPEYLVTNAWDYQMSMVQMNKLELEPAIHHLEKFLREFRGKSFVKDACQKLSWSYYLKGDMKLAEAARKRLLASGSTETDPDKKAQKDARSGRWPNVTLLRARLLSDGGYHREALSALNGKTAADFSSNGEKLELVYRLGRIYDDLKQYELALQYYTQAIDLGSGRQEYFAARASLQAAQIFELQGKKSTAIVYYKKCLDMEGHEYEDSIEQRAKAGIQRCKGE